MVDREALAACLAEFAGRIDEIYGLYLDASQGFQRNAASVEQLQKESQHLVSDPAELDSSAYFIGRGDPNDPNNVLLHRTTQGEFKARNAKGGTNMRRLSQYFVVLAYHLWEHEYRSRVAAILGLSSPDDLKLDVLGDLRLLRHEILKHGGVVSRETTKRLKLLHSFSEGDVISLSEEDMEALVRNIKAGCDELARDRTGVDPKLRTIWHVQ